MPKVLAGLIGAGDASILRPDDFSDQFVVLNNETLYDAEAGFSAKLSGVYDAII